MRRKSIESLPRQEEKSPLEMLQEIKKREEEIAKEDKTGTPWNTIDPNLITPENLEIFNLFNRGEFEQAQAKKSLAEIKLEEIKDKKTRESNEALIRYLDDKIFAELNRKSSKIEE